MRVIAGSARSVPLIVPKGGHVRPTTDRIKETLFNILQSEVPSSVFVDIFAGSGAIGIEALSRGAARAVFVDSDKASVEAVRQNLTKCDLMERAEVFCLDAQSVGRYFPRRSKDEHLIVFMDPPYGKRLEIAVITRLIDKKLLRADDLLIAEQVSDDNSLTECQGAWEILRVKEYGHQKHVFLRVKI